MRNICGSKRSTVVLTRDGLLYTAGQIEILGRLGDNTPPAIVSSLEVFTISNYRVNIVRFCVASLKIVVFTKIFGGESSSQERFIEGSRERNLYLLDVRHHTCFIKPILSMISLTCAPQSR